MRRSAYVEARDREAGSERLHHCERGVVVQAGKEKNIALSHKGAHLLPGDPSEKLDPVLDIQLPGNAPQSRFVPAPTADAQPPLRELSNGADRELESLSRNDASCVEGDWACTVARLPLHFGDLFENRMGQDRGLSTMSCGEQLLRVRVVHKNEL